jgi:hypothetical protein
MSAFVAFNGFPGQDVQDPIGTLLVQERQTPVNVSAKPVHTSVTASKQGTVAAGHRASAKHSRVPRASTGPVLQRSPTPATVPTPGQTPSSTPSSVAPSQTTTPVSVPTTPSVPNTGVTIPQITLPSLPSAPQTPPPSDNSSLPIDTSGITGVLGGG